MISDYGRKMDSHTIDRRTLLKFGASAAAGMILPGYTGTRAYQTPAPRASSVILPKVQVSNDRVIRSVAGLRPYRTSGFALRADRMGEKTVIHNYGHGGCGITLSWGTAKLAVDLALGQPHRKIAVLGSGAVGLATARLLQDHGFEVTIYTRDLPPNTTSNIAGGLWAPFTIADSDKRTSAFDAQLSQSSRFSHRYFQNLVGDRYGVRWLPLFMLSDDAEFGLPWTWQVAPEIYRVTNLGKSEHPFPSRGAARIYMMLIEPAIYLPAVLADFRTAGGQVIVRDFRDLAAVIGLKEQVIVNCTGLGAKALFKDEELIPVKGQLTFLTPQPELHYMYISGPSYMFPRRDGVLLGGTYEIGNSNTEPDESIVTGMLENHKRLAEGMR
jgi:glycine/D-amino acid oxidase-like deaminating enzyme